MAHGAGRATFPSRYSRVGILAGLLFVLVLSTACSASSGVRSANRESMPDSVLARDIAVRALKKYRSLVQPNFFNDWYDVNSPVIRRMVRIDAELNSALDSAAKLAPRDSLIQASRIWHLVNTAHYASADSLAASICGTGRWNKAWCSAIRGLTLFKLDDFAGAEEWFDQALQEMPETQRCMWTDPSYVLNDFELTAITKAIPCAERGKVHANIWWLADPQWTVPGNERRAAHLARWTEAMIAEGELALMGRNDFSAAQMNPHLETFLRLEMLELAEQFFLGCEGFTRRDCTGSYGSGDRFMPWAPLVRDPFGADILDYSFSQRQSGANARDGAEVRAPLYSSRISSAFGAKPGEEWRWTDYGEMMVSNGGKMHTIRASQIGAILRGDNQLLLAAFDARAAKLFHPSGIRGFGIEPYMPGTWFISSHYNNWMQTLPMRAAAALSSAPTARASLSPSVTLFVGEVARVLVALEHRADSALVSLEALSIEQVQEGKTGMSRSMPFSTRHRFAVFFPDMGVTGNLKTSDIILYAPPDTGRQPANADEVLARMLPRSLVSRDEKPGFYWEVYGLEAGDEPEFELSVAPVDSGSALGGLARALRLAPRLSSSLVRWKAPPVVASDLGQHGEVEYSLVVDIAALNTGVHILQLSTKVGADREVVVRKAVHITK